MKNLFSQLFYQFLQISQGTIVPIRPFFAYFPKNISNLQKNPQVSVKQTLGAKNYRPIY